MTDTANDLEILHPERTLTIDGRDVTVREYGFVEGIRLQAKIGPLLAGLEAIGEDDAGLAGLDALIAGHMDLVLELVARSCDQPIDWVRGLSDRDGQALLMTWWVVNADFFTSRIVQRAAMREAQNHARKTTANPAPAGAPSTKPWSATATPRSASDATPDGK